MRAETKADSLGGKQRESGAISRSDLSLQRRSTPIFIAVRLAIALNALALLVNLSVPLDYVAHGMPRLDFSAFWTAGKIVREEPAHLYDLETQRARQSEIPEDRFYPFLNPPHVAPFFALVPGNYSVASRVWAGVQVALLLLFGLSIWQATRQWQRTERLLILTTVLGSAVVGYGLVHGSLSLLIAIALFQWFRCDRLGQDSRAGLWLTLATFKPQAIILLAITLLRRRAQLIAFLAVCVALSLIATAVFGVKIWPDYLSMSRVVQSSEAQSLIGTDKMPNLKSLLVLSGFFSNGVAIVVAAIALLAGMLLTFLRSKGEPLQVALIVSSGLFLSPHLNVYDLSILTLPIILIYSESRSRRFAWFAVGVPMLMNLALIMGQGVLTVRLAQLFVPMIACWSAHRVSLKLRLRRMCLGHSQRSASL
jgi:hypothetical protein